MEKRRLFLDVHAIQTLPPSNINRDDTGSPKTARYGGKTRARVSSQAWKRAMRQYFSENSEEELGVRTKKIGEYVMNSIIRTSPSTSNEDAMQMAKDILKKAGIKLASNNETKALFFLGKKQADALAKAAIDGEQDKNKLKEIIKDNPSIDIALFGRMVADDPELNEDASCQVAHAISTHEVHNEFDYYTALDDLKGDDSSGAGMLGTVEYNSSTLYRYATVAVHELLHQLGDKELVVQTLQLFIEAFSNSLPTGKINTFANQTLPQALVVSIRDDRPANLVTAFETPIRSDNGYVDKSIKSLFEEEEHIEKFLHKPVSFLYLTDRDVVDKERFGESKSNMDELLGDIANLVNENL